MLHLYTHPHPYPYIAMDTDLGGNQYARGIYIYLSIFLMAHTGRSYLPYQFPSLSPTSLKTR